MRFNIEDKVLFGLDKTKNTKNRNELIYLSSYDLLESIYFQDITFHHKIFFNQKSN
jgi:hypothetical protein